MWNFASVLWLSMMSVTPADQLIFNNGAEPETLDPHKISSHDAALLSLQMHEGLVTRDATYAKVEPGLASRWEVSSDGLQYTFHIRSGLKWSNGEPIELEQIRHSFLRALDPKVAAPQIQQYTENIKGAEEYVKNYETPHAKEFESKLGIRIRGKDKIEFELKKPNVLFLDYLTQPQFAVIHTSMFAENSKAWTTPSEFITNGPYKLKLWEVNKQLVMVKNSFYRDASKVKIPTLVSLPITDLNTSYNLYRSKQVDWTGENTIPSTLVGSLRADTDFYVMPSYGTYTYVLNIRKKPLDDLRVRRALSLAIHRAEITDKIVKGGRVPANRYIPPGLESYRPAIEPPPPFDKQIEMAKALLVQAGYPDGKNFPRLTIAYNTEDTHHKVAQAVQQMWKKYLGIDVEIENMEWKVFLKENSQNRFDISRFSWIGDIPDPAEMLDVYIGGGANNHSLWSSAEYDRIIRSSYSIRDKKKRSVLLQKAEKILLDEVPFIPIYHYVFYSLMSSRIGGFKPNMYGKYQFKYFTKK